MIPNNPSITQVQMAYKMGMGSSGVGRALKRIGIVYKKMLSYQEADPLKQAEFREKIKNIPKDRLVYVDES